MRKDVSGWRTRLTAGGYRAPYRGRRMAQSHAGRLRTAPGAARAGAGGGDRGLARQHLRRGACTRRSAWRAPSPRSACNPARSSALQLPNWAETMALNLGACMAGLVVNPIVPIYREAEVRYILQATPHAAVPDPAKPSAASTIRPWCSACGSELPDLLQVVVLRGHAERLLELRGAAGGAAAAPGAPSRPRPQRGQARALHLGHDRHTERRAAQPQHHHVRDRRGDPLSGASTKATWC